MSGFEMTHAVLPPAAWLPLWVTLSWAMVLSGAVVRFSAGKRFAVWGAAAVAVLMLLPLPGGGTLSGYVALAFQTPSGVLVAWAAWCWADALQHSPPQRTTPTVVALAGVVLGWLLVLDTLNAWPSFFNPQLYALGFASAALWGVLALTAALLLWTQVPRRWALSAVAVLAAYALLRLPTGNLWDALLDPFVWLALHLQLWGRWRHRA